MEELKAKLNAFWRAAEELENCAVTVSANGRARLLLADSRLMRERALDSQIKGARAEMAILSIPINFRKSHIKIKK